MRIGISFKFPHLSLDTAELYSFVDFIEFAPEHFVKLSHDEMKFMKKLMKDKPIFWHCINGDIAGIYDINKELLQQYKKVLSQFNFMGYSDHMAYCRDSVGNYYFELLPSFCDKESKNNIINRIYETSKILFDNKYVNEFSLPNILYRQSFSLQ